MDPSAKFMESSSVLHRDFRRFDQKQLRRAHMKPAKPPREAKLPGSLSRAWKSIGRAPPLCPDKESRFQGGFHDVLRCFKMFQDVRCNPDVCGCRTFPPPVDVGGVRDVDTLDDDALQVRTDEDCVVAVDVADAVVMFVMLMAPSAAPPSSTSATSTATTRSSAASATSSAKGCSS